MRRVIAVVLLLAACKRGEVPRVESAGADPSVPPAGTAAPAAPPEAAPPHAGPYAADTGSTRWFSSVVSGFEMQIPNAWNQRVTASERSNPEEFPGATSIVEFTFLAETGTGGPPPSILTVLRFPTATWRDRKGSFPQATVLHTGPTDVFVMLPAGRNPYAEGSTDAQAFEAMRVGPELIRKGFRTP